VLAGSVEPYPHPLIQSGFRRMGVTSAEDVTRPFDLRRSGFTSERAPASLFWNRERLPPPPRFDAWTAQRLALGSDSHSAVAFNSNGARIADVIGRALARGGLSP